MKENLLKHKPTQIKNDEIESVYENGKITIIYPKKFGRIEKWVKDRIGGPDQVRRPLDKYTTFIWKNCNGDNNIAEIISEFEARQRTVGLQCPGNTAGSLSRNDVTTEHETRQRTVDVQCRHVMCVPPDRM